MGECCGVFFGDTKRNDLIFLGEIFLKGVAGYRFLWIGLEAKIGTHWRMPEPWIPYLPRDLYQLPFMESIATVRMGKRTRYTYVTVGPVICLQSRPFLGKIQLVVIFLIFYIPPLWGNYSQFDTFQSSLGKLKKVARGTAKFTSCW